MGLVAFLGLGYTQVCEWMYHLLMNQGCQSAVNRGCSNLFQFLRQSSNNGLWILPLIFLLFRATMAFLYALTSSLNTVNYSPSLWARGSSPLVRLPSFSLMQLFACLEFRVVYYKIVMSTSLLHFGLVCGQFLVHG